MAKPVSRVKFALRVGGNVADPGGTWTDFDDSIGYIEDWSGLLSEGPVGGDIIQQDWVDGALWQQGKNRTYSFDVPFTALVPAGTVEPNLWDSYGGVSLLKKFRGPQLTMRREFLDKSGAVVRQDQAVGVLVTDLPATVGIGRVIAGVAVFQNLSGYWNILPAHMSSLQEDFSDALDPLVWSVPSGFAVSDGQGIWTFGGAVSDQRVITVDSFTLVGDSLVIETLGLSQSMYTEVTLFPLAMWDKNTNFCTGFRITYVGGLVKLNAYFLSSDLKSVTWSSVTHRWLKISETNGSIYWYTSPDRVTWTQFHVAAWSGVSGWTPHEVKVGTSVAVTSAAVPVGVATFDNFNTTGATIMAAAMTDTFDRLDRNRWYADPGIVSTATTNGKLAFDWNGTAGSTQYIYSKSVVNLVGSSVTMQVVTIDPVARPLEYEVVEIWSENQMEYVFFRIWYSLGVRTLIARSSRGNIGVSVDYSPVSHAWLRISESGGTLTFQTSANRTTWSTFGSIAASTLGANWRTSTVRVGAVRQYSDAAATGTFRVMELDNLNTTG